VTQKLLRLLKQHGVLGLIRHAFRRKCPLHLMMVYRKTDTSNTCTTPDLLVKRYSSLPDVDADIITACEATFGQATSRDMNKLFSKGHDVWLGMIGNQVTGVCWSRSHEKRSDYFMPLAESDATILGCTVDPASRGRGIYPAMLEIMVNTLIDQERISCVYIDSKNWNRASIRGIHKAGFGFAGKAIRLVLFERVWILWNRCEATGSLDVRASGPSQRKEPCSKVGNAHEV
jgi:ribosomal protein S18 acetylase RimI-like enzyme